MNLSIYVLIKTLDNHTTHFHLNLSLQNKNQRVLENGYWSENTGILKGTMSRR